MNVALIHPSLSPFCEVLFNAIAVSGHVSKLCKQSKPFPWPCILCAIKLEFHSKCIYWNLWIFSWPHKKAIRLKIWKVTRKDAGATKCSDSSYGTPQKLTGDEVREVENVGEWIPVEYLLVTIDSRSGKGERVFEWISLFSLLPVMLQLCPFDQDLTQAIP